jgi:hypothetical protein
LQTINPIAISLQTSSNTSVALPMPYMSVIGIDRQEGQTPKADKDPKRQSGIPKERVKHNAPPLTALSPFALV